MVYVFPVLKILFLLKILANVIKAIFMNRIGIFVSLLVLSVRHILRHFLSIMALNASAMMDFMKKMENVLDAIQILIQALIEKTVFVMWGTFMNRSGVSV